MAHRQLKCTNTKPRTLPLAVTALQERKLTSMHAGYIRGSPWHVHERSRVHADRPHDATPARNISCKLDKRMPVFHRGGTSLQFISSPFVNVTKKWIRVTRFQPGTIYRYVQRETTLVNIHVMKLEEAVFFFFWQSVDTVTALLRNMQTTVFIKF